MMLAAQPAASGARAAGRKRVHHEEDLAGGSSDEEGGEGWSHRQAQEDGGSDPEGRFEGAAPGSSGGAPVLLRGSSRYIGVTWDKRRSVWVARLRDPPTKRLQHIGTFASEEDAARAYDCAAVQALGPNAKRNFPGEAISELPVTVGEKRKEKQHSSSRFIGVSWHKSSSSWYVQLYHPQTKRCQAVGCFSSEDDAARAYDFAAVQAHGPGAKRNFPGEAISEPPVTVGEERKDGGSSRYFGVNWDERRSSYVARLRDPQTKRVQHIGSFAFEEDAARAYDCAAVKAHGPTAKRNFPDEVINEQPVTVGEERRSKPLKARKPRKQQGR